MHAAHKQAKYDSLGYRIRQSSVSFFRTMLRRQTFKYRNTNNGHKRSQNGHFEIRADIKDCEQEKLYSQLDQPQGQNKSEAKQALQSEDQSHVSLGQCRINVDQSPEEDDPLSQKNASTSKSSEGINTRSNHGSDSTFVLIKTHDFWAEEKLGSCCDETKATLATSECTELPGASLRHRKANYGLLGSDDRTTAPAVEAKEILRDRRTGARHSHATKHYHGRHHHHHHNTGASRAW